MAKIQYNDSAIRCQAGHCMENAAGETSHVNEDTLKSERLFFCTEHLRAYNKALHH